MSTGSTTVTVDQTTKPKDSKIPVTAFCNIKMMHSEELLKPSIGSKLQQKREQIKIYASICANNMNRIVPANDQ